MSTAHDLTETDRRIREASDRVRAFAEALLAWTQAPGIAIAITDRNRTIVELPLGFADPAAGVPVAPDTLFESGSIGKSFTAALVMQLVDQGIVDLHVPVQTYLPWFEVQSDYGPITLHHLLSHTAGIISGFEHSPDGRSEVWSLRHTKAFAPPGERFSYSNLGYKALGLVLERVTGQTCQSLVEERIFQPLGMRHSHGAITDRIRDDLAVGHVPRFGDRPWQPEHGFAAAPWLETGTADGCLAMTAGDLAVWARCLLNDGRGVLSPARFAEMITPVLGWDARPTYGYGLGVRRENGVDIIEHEGGMVGYISSMTVDRSNGFGVVVLANAMVETPLVAEYASEVLRAAYTGGEWPDPPDVLTDALPGDIAGLDGSWRDPVAGLAIEVVVGADRLSVDVGNGPLALRPSPHGLVPDTYLIAGDSDWARFPVTFERDDDGRIIACRHGEHRFLRDGVSGLPAPETSEVWRSCVGHYRSHNPWVSGMRVVLRHGHLYMIFYRGSEQRLVPEGDGFRVGDGDIAPNWIRFSDIADGKALRLIFENGAEYHRFFTP